MPTYEYVCKSCGHLFDIVQSMRDDTLTECPECGGELRKIFAPPAIAFKGSGFYATDHGKKGSKPRGDSKTGGDPKTDGDSKGSGDSKTGGDPKGGGDSKGSGDTSGDAAKKDSSEGSKGAPSSESSSTKEASS